MADQIDVLRLGGFTFTDFAVPDLISAGGRQAMVIHKLPGGARVIDTLGPDENDIVWRGQFFANNAISLAVQLDALRKQGQLLPLTFAGQSRQVVISHFIWSVRRYPMWVEYAITCTVNQHGPTSGASSASNIDSQVSQDAEAGSNAANNSTGGGVFDTGTTPFGPSSSGGQPLGQQ